jgi:hypothetical protein
VAPGHCAAAGWWYSSGNRLAGWPPHRVQRRAPLTHLPTQPFTQTRVPPTGAGFANLTSLALRSLLAASPDSIPGILPRLPPRCKGQEGEDQRQTLRTWVQIPTDWQVRCWSYARATPELAARARLRLLHVAGLSQVSVESTSMRPRSAACSCRQCARGLTGCRRGSLSRVFVGAHPRSAHSSRCLVDTHPDAGHAPVEEWFPGREDEQERKDDAPSGRSSRTATASALE